MSKVIFVYKFMDKWRTTLAGNLLKRKTLGLNSMRLEYKSWTNSIDFFAGAITSDRFYTLISASLEGQAALKTSFSPVNS